MLPVQTLGTIPSPSHANPLRRARHTATLTTILLVLLPATRLLAQIDTTSIAPHRYLVLYRNAAIPGDAEARILSTGATLTRRNEHLGIAARQIPPHAGRRLHAPPP